jgi:hypothetical protein
MRFLYDLIWFRMWRMKECTLQMVRMRWELSFFGWEISDLGHRDYRVVECFQMKWWESSSKYFAGLLMLLNHQWNLTYFHISKLMIIMLHGESFIMTQIFHWISGRNSLGNRRFWDDFGKNEIARLSLKQRSLKMLPWEFLLFDSFLRIILFAIFWLLGSSDFQPRISFRWRIPREFQIGSTRSFILQRRLTKL